MEELKKSGATRMTIFIQGVTPWHSWFPQGVEVNSAANFRGLKHLPNYESNELY